MSKFTMIESYDHWDFVPIWEECVYDYWVSFTVAFKRKKDAELLEKIVKQILFKSEKIAKAKVVKLSNFGYAASYLVRDDQGSSSCMDADGFRKQLKRKLLAA